MKCTCGSKEALVEGTLEGVSFEPTQEAKKLVARGVYGLTATVCPACGRIGDLRLNTEALKSVLKR